MMHITDVNNIVGNAPLKLEPVVMVNTASTAFMGKAQSLLRATEIATVNDNG